MIRKVHDWSEQDEALLCDAVLALEPLREGYEERGIPAAQYWSAVAGRIAPAVCVTGKACRERWATIEARRKEQQPKGEHDAWADVADKVERYERDLGEATYDVAAQTLRQMEFVVERVESIGAAADVALAGLREQVDRLVAEWTGQDKEDDDAE